MTNFDSLNFNTLKNIVNCQINAQPFDENGEDKNVTIQVITSLFADLRASNDKLYQEYGLLQRIIYYVWPLFYYFYFESMHRSVSKKIQELVTQKTPQYLLENKKFNWLKSASFTSETLQEVFFRFDQDHKKLNIQKQRCQQLIETLNEQDQAEINNLKNKYIEHIDQHFLSETSLYDHLKYKFEGLNQELANRLSTHTGNLDNANCIKVFTQKITQYSADLEAIKQILKNEQTLSKELTECKNSINDQRQLITSFENMISEGTNQNKTFILNQVQRINLKLQDLHDQVTFSSLTSFKKQFLILQNEFTLLVKYEKIAEELFQEFSQIEKAVDSLDKKLKANLEVPSKTLSELYINKIEILELDMNSLLEFTLACKTHNNQIIDSTKNLQKLSQLYSDFLAFDQLKTKFLQEKNNLEHAKNNLLSRLGLSNKKIDPLEKEKIHHFINGLVILERVYSGTDLDENLDLHELDEKRAIKAILYLENILGSSTTNLTNSYKEIFEEHSKATSYITDYSPKNTNNLNELYQNIENTEDTLPIDNRDDVVNIKNPKNNWNIFSSFLQEVDKVVYHLTGDSLKTKSPIKPEGTIFYNGLRVMAFLYQEDDSFKNSIQKLIHELEPNSKKAELWLNELENPQLALTDLKVDFFKHLHTLLFCTLSMESSQDDNSNLESTQDNKNSLMNVYKNLVSDFNQLKGVTFSFDIDNLNQLDKYTRTNDFILSISEEIDSDTLQLKKEEYAKIFANVLGLKEEDSQQISFHSQLLLMDALRLVNWLLGESHSSESNCIKNLVENAIKELKEFEIPNSLSPIIKNSLTFLLSKLNVKIVNGKINLLDYSWVLSKLPSWAISSFISAEFIKNELGSKKNKICGQSDTLFDIRDAMIDKLFKIFGTQIQQQTPQFLIPLLNFYQALDNYKFEKCQKNTNQLNQSIGKLLDTIFKN